jgi:hypothetical protein
MYSQGVEDLGLGNPQGLGDLQDRFAAPVQRGHVAHGHAQPINDGLASANAIEANNVAVLRVDGQPGIIMWIGVCSSPDQNGLAFGR